MEKELSPAGKLAKKIWPVVLVVAGNAMYALAVRLFLMPAGLVTGNHGNCPCSEPFLWHSGIRLCTGI